MAEPHWARLVSQAQSWAQAGKWDDAAACYQAVLAQNPEQPDAQEGLGLAALHGDRVEEALGWFERAKRNAPTNARVHSNLGIALKRNGQLSEAIAAYQQAFALDPQATILFNLGRAERDAGRLADAILTFQRALELNRDAPEVWSVLSNALREAGRFEAAINAGRQAASKNPWLGQSHLNLGAALHQSGQFEEAVICYWVASTVSASRAAATSNLRVALADERSRSLATARPAVELVRRLLETPEDIDAIRALGSLARRKKNNAAAVLCFERVAELVGSASAYREVAMFLFGVGHLEQAEQRMLRAVEIDPGDLQGYRQLGVWLGVRCHLLPEGVRFQAVLARCPDDIYALVNLGVAMQRQGRPSEATRLHRRAIALSPDLTDAHLNLGSALCDQGLFAEAHATYLRALALEPKRWGIVSNLLFSLHFDPAVSPETIFEEHVAYGRRFAEASCASPPKYSQTSEPGRRLRIGYVSPDFKEHPVAYFLEPVLAEHDRATVEVYCYSDVPRPDAVTERLRRSVSKFVECAGWSDAALAERILSEEIDILVDLAGHTGKNRLLVFARKPSPVQVSWLGYFDTTGFAAIDYRIADEHSIPREAERFFVEQVVRLPRSSNCFLPRKGPPPAAAPCAQRGYVTFGCFNNPAKVTRDVVRVFARILRETPGSRLVLKYAAFTDPVLRAGYLAGLAEGGISEDRIDILGHSSLEHYFASFGSIDIALDPFPYSGETTALHSLWMGVPVVALEGTTLVQRLASRVLRVAGLSEWVASSADDYVRIATSLARDPAALARRRVGLRAELQASPLLDHEGVTRELEAAYRKMWQAWCSRISGDAGR